MRELTTFGQARTPNDIAGLQLVGGRDLLVSAARESAVCFEAVYSRCMSDF